MRERDDSTTPRSVQRRHRALLHSGTLSRGLSADPAASELVKVADLRLVQLPHRACDRPARFVRGASPSTSEIDPKQDSAHIYCQLSPGWFSPVLWEITVPWRRTLNAALSPLRRGFL